MMMRLITSLLLLASASAFTSPQLSSGARALSTACPTRQFMFSKDDDAKPATPPAAKALESVDAPETEEENVVEPSSVYKDMNTGEMTEVKWVDPAMAANTNPLMLSPWAFAFFIPFILLIDDVFHFLPKEGPFSFLVNK